MDKITFLEFLNVMACELNNSCIEIHFSVDGYADYQDSWLGKMKDRDTTNDLYWFGLTPDGSQAHDFDTFESFVNAKVFCGNRSLKEIWNLVSIFSFCGCSVNELLPSFLDGTPSKFGQASKF